MSRNLPKIAFILGRVEGTGGIPRVLSIISNQLANLEFSELHILSFHPAEFTGFHWNSKIIFHDLLKDFLNMRKGILPAAKRLRKILKENNIDILVICGHNVGPLSILSKIGLKTKLVYWPHSSFQGYATPFKSFNEQLNSALVDAVVTLTKTDQKNYLKKTLASKVVQIYNPIDPELSKQKVNYLPDAKKIISVGRLSMEKNFHSHLIDVAKIVLNRHKEYVWHIYGSGEFKSEIENCIVQNNLQDKVILMGHHDDIYSVYTNYSILVMTSEFEGFPMSLLEGMCNGLPMVSFDVPTGPNEIIQDGHNGYLIKPFDINSMADSLSHLIDNKMIRKNFSKNNKEFTSDFGLKLIISKWISLFDHCLRR